MIDFRSLLTALVISATSVSPLAAQECCCALATDVHVAVLSEIRKDSAARPLIVRDSTARSSFMTAAAISELSSAHADLRGRFLQNTRSAGIVDPSVIDPFDGQILTASALRGLPVTRNGYWDAFYELFPGAADFLQLSAVGFNDECTEAIVEVIRRCGRLCAEGSVFHVQLQNGEWRVQNREKYLIS